MAITLTIPLPKPAILLNLRAAFLFPHDDPQVIAGQGTIGLEILEDLYDVDNVIVPIGGGGLIAGIAIAIKSINPTIRIIGVQSENVHGMAASCMPGKSPAIATPAP